MDRLLPRRSLLTTLAGAALVVAVLAAAPALAKGRNTYRLVIGSAKSHEPLSPAARKKFAKLVATRLEKRLHAAGVKDFNVSVVDGHTLSVEAAGAWDRSWMRAVLTAPGKLELRPLSPHQPNWLELAGQMPKGVEIRGGQSSPTHVWSASRKTLEKFLARVAFSHGELAVYPANGGGWRSLSLGPPVATRESLTSARAETTSRGTTFVALAFASSVSARLAAASTSEVKQSAVVLDGEVVAVVDDRGLADHRIQLTAPRGAVGSGRDEQKAWAFQIAGRLAAPLPIPIAVLEE